MAILNSIVKTPHRALEDIYPIHKQAMEQDPIFYRQLGAWYASRGDIRDHQEMFALCLSRSEFDGHKDVGLALLRELPPHQIVRVVEFIVGTDRKVYDRKSDGKRKTTTVTRKHVGLDTNLQNAMKREIERYLRERERDDDWFDSAVLRSRRNILSLYITCRIKPSERAQKVLFDREYPENSKIGVMKAIQNAQTPADKAKLIIENKVPFQIAVSLIDQMTPTILLSLIEGMSDQDLINSMGMLKRRGAFENPDLRQVITARLDRAKKSKGVSATKAAVAAKAAGVDEEAVKKLEEVGDAQIRRFSIKSPAAVLIDKSSSMSSAIEVGKQIAAAISGATESDLFVYAMDTIAYPIASAGRTMSDWDKAMKGIHATGGTSLGCGIASMTRNRQRAELFILISDQEEVSAPLFLIELKKYIQATGITPHVSFVRVGKALDQVERQLKNEGIEFDTYTFNGDYTSIPALVKAISKGKKFDLLTEIMEFPLPSRRP
jgi:hypothetical protein